MNASKLIVSVISACAFLCGCASAETPAMPPAQFTDLKPISDPHDPVNEEDPVRLRAISCQILDLVMATNYASTATLSVAQQELAKRGYPASTDHPEAAAYVKRFKLERKEYKSRCKGPATEFEAVKKKYPHNPYIPNA
jgi:hypothetical protein